MLDAPQTQGTYAEFCSFCHYSSELNLYQHTYLALLLQTFKWDFVPYMYLTITYILMYEQVILVTPPTHSSILKHISSFKKSFPSMILAMFSMKSLFAALDTAKISTVSENQSTTTQCHQPRMEIRLTILFVKTWL